jgi:hypothetical protein
MNTIGAQPIKIQPRSIVRKKSGTVSSAAPLFVFQALNDQGAGLLFLQTLRRHVNRLRNATKMAEPRIDQMIGNF